MTALRVRPGTAPFATSCTVPGDKSIAHRALLLGALADGTTVVRGFPGGADVRATLEAIRALGVSATWVADEVRVVGAGLECAPEGPVRIDCANSGTTMRLGAGLVAGQVQSVTLDGDASLRRRPMERVAVPLRAMGAQVETTAGFPPLRVAGGRLHGVEWTLPVASAQVKSALLLAGLRADGTTRVHEPVPTRDHTERMLGWMGVRLDHAGGVVQLTGGQRLRGSDIPLPGDPSSAAFLLVAALLVPGASLAIRDVCVNPTRTGVLAILARMGARIEVVDPREVAGEPWGRLEVRHAPLRGTQVEPAEVPAAIDELPVLAVAAAFADGETRIHGAAELRVKESDRLAGLAQLRDLGVPLEVTEDGLLLRGHPERTLRSGLVRTQGDHRLAMAFAVAALRCPEGLVLDEPGCVDVSFPGFFARLEQLGAIVEPA